MVTLRPAATTDAPAVANLVAQVGYPAEPAAVAERLARLHATPDALLLVAEADGAIVGWLHAHAQVTLAIGSKVEIMGLVVAAGHRRSGAGRALVAATERWAADRDAAVVVVRSNVRREESHRFYLALGFTHSKTQAVYQKPGTVHAD